MSRHHETFEGLCENVDTETQSYIFNQTMLRIKDPQISLDFYTRIIGMKLYRKPFRPTVDDLHQNGKNFPPNFLHESWMDYLYWDVELLP